MRNVSVRYSTWLALTVAAISLFRPARACGPVFPNSMLDRGDEAVLEAPNVNFFVDWRRIPLPRAKFRAHNVKDFAGEAADADAADLREALQKLDAGDRSEILRAYVLQRARLTSLREKLHQSNPPNAGPDSFRPMMDDIDTQSIARAPREFVEYLEGSTAWYNCQTNRARELWQSLLRLPPEERHYRSTWAAYMLGKARASDDAEEAVAYFQQVRSLKLRGFSDRLGLAAASLGEEARVRLTQTNPVAAINLYLQQLAAGDDSADSSLGFACRQALTNGDETLTRLAADPLARRVMTAYVVSDRHQYDDDESFRAHRLQWLGAVEAAGVKDMECADELALAAYQAGEWTTAERWIERAPNSPTSQWLQTKLLLRAGKIDEAATLLHRIVELFPSTDCATNDVKPEGLQDALEMRGSTYTTGYVSIHAQTLAETGVLHLTRREYTEALDALLRSGFWVDAAYVAERVLTAEDLKSYVDQNWPATQMETNNVNLDVNMDIRYLLGRRLARSGQWSAARAYYPQSQLTNYDALVKALTTAENPETSKEEKVNALWDSARMIRGQGMELLGTEVEPDWAVESAFEGSLTITTRAGTKGQINRASEDELARVQNGVDPGHRFHYRYDAAWFAMEAANLLPDNTDDKAMALCTAGSWLKVRDPQAADVFYKSLVRHCRKTAIGKLADRMRWFPELDAEGNPLPWKPAPPVEIEPPAKAAGDGFWYSLSRGDTLEDVAETVSQQHQLAVTIAEIQKANPDVNVNRLKAGLFIFVPKAAPPADAGQ